jgi:hypothetical protein
MTHQRFSQSRLPQTAAHLHNSNTPADASIAPFKLEEVRRRAHIHQWVASVLREKALTPSAKVTGFALSTHFNFKTAQCNPSAKRLALVTSQSPRAVYNHINLLREVGYINWGRPLGRRANRYELTIPDHAFNTSTKSNERDSPRDEGGNTLNGGAYIDTDTLNEAAEYSEQESGLLCTVIHTNLENLENREAEILRDLRFRLGGSESYILTDAKLLAPNVLEVARKFHANMLREKLGMRLSELGLTVVQRINTV